MILIILIAFVSLVSLLVIHEFGHFILAKRFGAKVEEFGIGYPPRIFGKKIGETIYSINLIPFGAFVKILGEVEGVEGIRSFSNKPMYQRVLIILGGVIAFWIASWVLLSIVMALGMPSMVRDEQNTNLINPNVQIVDVKKNSPAQEQGIEMGDIILKMEAGDRQLETTKVKPLIEFINEHKGQEIVFTLKRGERIFDTTVVPRVSPPEGEGALGIAPIRTAIIPYPIYEAPFRGAIETGNLTIAAVQGWIMVGSSLIKGDGMPEGAELMGPVGIFELFIKMSALGVNHFLRFIAIISIFLALFNVLPIPALDGGKLVFLGIEAIRKKPVSVKIEQNITAFFFILLILLMVVVTYKDIQKLL